MTIPLVSIAFIAIGGLVYGLAAGKVAELGRILLLVGLLVLGLALAGKGVHLASLIGEGTAHAQAATSESAIPDDAPSVDNRPEDEARAAPAEDVVSPTDEREPDVDRIYAAVRSGQWVVAAGLVLLALVWVVRKYGGKLWPALLTDRGGVLTSLALAFAGALASTLAAGRVPGVGDVMAALGLAFTASGGWTMVRRLVNPKSTESAPPPTPPTPGT